MAEPIVELEYGTASDGGPNALRVLDDGRFELRSDVDVDVAADGTATLRHVEPEWRLQWTYGPDELGELEHDVAAAAKTVRPRYEADGQVIHPRTLVWRLRTDGETVESVVEGFPATRVQELDRLYRRLFELHRPEQESSLWRVRTPGGVVERLVEGEAERFAALRPVLDAIYRPGPADEGAGAAPAADGTPLLEIEWRSGDDPVDTTRVLEDGRQEVVHDGKTEQLEPLRGSQLDALRAALAATDWESLPAVLRAG